MTLQENADGTRVKIFIGAGLYWWVWADSLRTMDINEFLADMDETLTDYNKITGGTN